MRWKLLLQESLAKELLAMLHQSSLVKVSEENFLREDFYIFSKTITRQ